MINNIIENFTLHDLIQQYEYICYNKTLSDAIVQADEFPDGDIKKQAQKICNEIKLYNPLESFVSFVI